MIHLTQSEENLYKCHVCQKKFLYINNLKTHLLTHTNAKHNFHHHEDLVDGTDSKLQLQLPSREKPYVFQVWKNHVPKKESVQQGEQSIICVKTEKPSVSHTDKAPFKDHLLHFRVEAGEIYKGNQHHLKNHASKITDVLANSNNKPFRIHTKEKPFVCNICQKGFQWRYQLNIHVGRHTGEKPYQCKFCQKRYYLKTYLNQHLLIHSGEKPFECAICQKAFSQKVVLNQHLRKHNMEKSDRYSCDVCQKRFSQRTFLIMHLRTHTGEKPCVCDVCQKAFAFKSSLDRHILIHTGEKPFVCEFCQKGFVMKSELNLHLVIHTGKKRFVCEVCQEKFRSKSFLKRHFQVHTGEKPFSCEICQKKFRLKSVLNRHVVCFHPFS